MNSINKHINNKDGFYEALLNKSTQGLTALRTAIVHPVEELSLLGAVESAQKGLIEPVLVGPSKRIKKAAREASIDISSYEIINTEHSHQSAEMAVSMARKGAVDALMKGHIHTDEFMEFVVSKTNGLRTGRRVSHVFCIDIPHKSYPKPLWLSDAAINIEPTLEDKKDIIQNAIDLYRACGLGTPKVAILSATEKIFHKIPSTVEAAALCKMADRGWITGGIIDGPLAFDNAVSKDAANKKHIKSKVTGDADILIVPDIESGNMLYKQMKYLSGYNAAGLVMGARVPIMLTSRAGGSEARLASAALAVLYVHNRETRKI